MAEIPGFVADGPWRLKMLLQSRLFGGVASGAAQEERDQGNRALDPAIRLFNTYVRLIRAQVPALLDRVVDEIPESCEGERCLRFKLTVVREGFFDVIDEVNPSVA